MESDIKIINHNPPTEFIVHASRNIEFNFFLFLFLKFPTTYDRNPINIVRPNDLGRSSLLDPKAPAVSLIYAL